MHNIDSYFPLIEALCYKYGSMREPVRDSFEFSVACEAFLESAGKFDPASPVFMPADLYFKYFISLRIRQRLIDYRRKMISASKRHQKAVEVAKKKPTSEMNKKVDKVDLYEILLTFDRTERIAAGHYLNTGLVPTGNLQRAWYRVMDKIRRAWVS